MKKGKWICFPGDFEIYLAEKVNARRYQRDFPIRPFWRVDSPWHNVKFYKEFTIDKPTKMKFYYEGSISVFFYDFDFRYEFDGEAELDAGSYKMEVWLYNPNGIPALRIDGEDIVTDESFLVGYNHIDMQKPFVCEVGDMTPNTYALPCRKIDWVKEKKVEGGAFYDFGKMIFAFACLTGKGKYKVYFGETVAETMSNSDCEQTDFFTLETEGTHRTPVSKGFRYLRVVGENEYSLSVEEELDEKQSISSFKSENELLEKIFDISKYTFSLCAREFYLDGIKRDRWLWGGDAYVAEKAEYYFLHDAEKIKRNIIALFGKAPVTRYINHIMDYTFYTVISVWEYYAHTGDKAFLEYIEPIMTEHIEFCMKRLSQDGFICSIPLENGEHVDWIFVDWGVDYDRKGEVSSEQVLFYAALKSVEKIYNLLGKSGGERYAKFARKLQEKVNEVFWNEDRGCYVFARNNGVLTEEATCHTNVFALLYDFADENKKSRILQSLVVGSLSLSVTPFMISFCLEALFKFGEHKKAAEILLDFWGGMAKLGVSTFWETYRKGDEEESALCMYGRPFDHSHCHIWGAGPLYLIPRFYFGIYETDFGNSFVIEPNLELIKNSSICVPMKKGTLTVSYQGDRLVVVSKELTGKLKLAGKTYDVEKGENIIETN